MRVRWGLSLGGMCRVPPFPRLPHTDTTGTSEMEGAWHTHALGRCSLLFCLGASWFLPMLKLPQSLSLPLDPTESYSPDPAYPGGPVNPSLALTVTWHCCPLALALMRRLWP